VSDTPRAKDEQVNTFIAPAFLSVHARYGYVVVFGLRP